MYYMLYCDLSTLNCTSKELENKIASYSNKYHKINDNFWLFSVSKYIASTVFMEPNEYLIINILEEYITENSIIFSSKISSKQYYCELPQDAINFLSIDNPDND